MDEYLSPENGIRKRLFCKHFIEGPVDNHFL